MMQKDSVFVSIIIPVFNEEFTVGNVIERAMVVAEKCNFLHEIIVVDDCSTDGSLEILKSKKVKVYRLKRHMGKGYALRVGLKRARGNIIVMMDSDGSHQPEDLPKMLSRVSEDKADLVIGSRFMRSENLFVKKINRVGVQLFNFLIRILTGKAVTDSQSGYRVMKSSILRDMDLKSNGYEIESEMLIKAIKKGCRIKEVPIKFEQRTYGKSKLDPLKDGVKILISTLLAYVGVW